MTARLIERLWYDEGAGSRVVRAFLSPAGMAFRVTVSLRNALYDRGTLVSYTPSIPVLSVGNLTVGGTGKTPVAAWAAQRLRAAGARPAVVLRDYGGDESAVHARLTPGIIVVADADRVRGVEHARALGADCAILDDGFQHRRLRRHADWVLVAAERWPEAHRPLPVGPLREPVTSLRRADLLIVTRKTASQADADEVIARLSRYVGTGECVVCHLAPGALVHALHANREEPLSWLVGRAVVGVAAIGAPSAFFGQLRGAGVRVDEVAFRDHHAFDARDVALLARRAENTDGVVCTLKDVVKLGPVWPPAGPPLWYVSQRTVIERGGATLDAALDVVLAARPHASPTAGSAGLSSPAHGYRSSLADE